MVACSLTAPRGPPQSAAGARFPQASRAVPRLPRTPRPGCPRRTVLLPRPGLNFSSPPTGRPPVAERWRPVPACRWFGIKAGQAEASSEGRVRSVDRTLTDGREAGGQVLTPTADRDGYLRVKLGRRLFGVHVLVCLAWHGPPEVRHLGDGPQANKPAELAWGSRRDNERDKRKQEKEKDIRSRPLPIGTYWDSDLD